MNFIQNSNTNPHHQKIKVFTCLTIFIKILVDLNFYFGINYFVIFLWFSDFSIYLFNLMANERLIGLGNLDKNNDQIPLLNDQTTTDLKGILIENGKIEREINNEKLVII